MTLKILFPLLCICLTSCTVKINDNEWCGDMGSLGATCFHTLSDKSRDISKEEWDKERVGQICTTGDSFANWKEAILQLCKQTSICSFQVVNTVNTVADKAEKTSKKAKQ